MALPSSGQISLSQVNTELSYATTAQISMNASAVRTLFQKSSGSISMSDGWGKSACASYGTFLYYACSGTDYYAYYANGSCGTYTSLIESNSCNCPGGTGPSYGTELSSTCSGTTKITEFANGNCGTFTETITNNCDCGGTGPANGTATGYSYCDGTHKKVEYFDGNCGVYIVDEGEIACQCGVSDGHYAGELNYTFCLYWELIGNYYYGPCDCCYNQTIHGCYVDCGFECCADCSCWCGSQCCG